MAGQPLLASHGSLITAVTYQSNHHVNPQEKDNHHVAGFTQAYFKRQPPLDHLLCRTKEANSGLCMNVAFQVPRWKLLIRPCLFVDASRNGLFGISKVKVAVEYQNVFMSDVLEVTIWN
jgi:hypothetical protein